MAVGLRAHGASQAATRTTDAEQFVSDSAHPVRRFRGGGSRHRRAGAYGLSSGQVVMTNIQHGMFIPNNRNATRAIRLPGTSGGISATR